MKPIKEFTCEDLLHYLSDYIDGELDEELSDAARRHLATCQNCKVVLNTTRRTIELAGTEVRRTIPAERRQNLYDQLQDAFLKREEKKE